MLEERIGYFGFKKKKMIVDLNEKYGDLYYKTKEKEFNIKKSGYEIISIWENDFKKKIKNKK